MTSLGSHAAVVHDDLAVYLMPGRVKGPADGDTSPARY